MSGDLAWLRAGDRVDYFSKKYGDWVPATVERLHKNGLITLDIKKSADPRDVRRYVAGWSDDDGPDSGSDDGDDDYEKPRRRSQSRSRGRSSSSRSNLARSSSQVAAEMTRQLSAKERERTRSARQREREHVREEAELARELEAIQQMQARLEREAQRRSVSDDSMWSGSDGRRSRSRSRSRRSGSGSGRSSRSDDTIAAYGREEAREERELAQEAQAAREQRRRDEARSDSGGYRTYAPAGPQAAPVLTPLSPRGYEYEAESAPDDERRSKVFFGLPTVGITLGLPKMSFTR